MDKKLPATLSSLDMLGSNIMEQINIVEKSIIYNLNERHLKIIYNAFEGSLVIDMAGLPWFKVDMLGNLLRTGNSGAHRYMVDNGIAGMASSCVVQEYNGTRYVSGPSFIALIYARKSLTRGKQRTYIDYVIALYNNLVNNYQVIKMRDMFIDTIVSMRPQLKSERIEQYGINSCEFTGDSFSRPSEVEFAHIESVITTPSAALDIDNGVIIFKSIHAELTKRQVHDFHGMYTFCSEKGYLLTWAKNY